jgi:signal transduction histidine kinase
LPVQSKRESHGRYQAAAANLRQNRNPIDGIQGCIALAIKRHPAVWAIVVIAAVLLGIELGLRFTPPDTEHWHYALHRFYYLAIITGALTFGWTGGLLTAVISGVLYVLHASDIDSPDARNVLDRYLETLVFCLVGLVAGILSNRERKHRLAAERATEELQDVYRELQDNVEHVKRAARMSALGHMSAGLAHEIRNPLAGIDGAAAILREQPNGDKKRTEFLDIIQKEARRLDRLVTNFLGFARPRAPEMQSVQIGPLIQSVVDVIKQTTARHHIDFSVEISDNLPPLRCDAEQIKQVLLNLTLNSVQAMPLGGAISIASRLQNNQVMVRVCDTGPGIPPSDMDFIYDPFFTTKETGTGLGLPTAYQIVEQHGGELRVEKSDSSGTCFVFTLPAGDTARS